MWVTVFVIDQKEHLSDKDFPAFQVGGKLCLYLKDAIDGENVPKGYAVSKIIYDLYSDKPRQYVYLSALTES